MRLPSGPGGLGYSELGILDLYFFLEMPHLWAETLGHRDLSHRDPAPAFPGPPHLGLVTLKQRRWLAGWVETGP